MATIHVNDQHIPDYIHRGKRHHPLQIEASLSSHSFTITDHLEPINGVHMAVFMAVLNNRDRIVEPTNDCVPTKAVIPDRVTLDQWTSSLTGL